MGRAKHCTDQERSIIRNLSQKGKSQRQIAETIGKSQHFVFNALRPQNQRLKTGRPRKTTNKDDDHIKLMSAKDPFKSAGAIKIELGLPISTRTVRRRLEEKNLLGRHSRKVPLLTKKQKKNRINFAKNHESWDGLQNAKKWRNILWSDESKINMIGNDGKTWVRRPKNQELNPRYTTKTFKHGGGSIMVWGCFSWYGVGPLYWIKTIMDKNLYIKILEEVMLPFAEWEMPLKWQFQQDNDPKHTAKLTKQWFLNKQIDVMVWPSQSPDLNPIENLWKIVKDEIGPIKPKNKEELWEKIKTAWYSIPLSTCQALVESMPRRCKAILASKGNKTKY